MRTLTKSTMDRRSFLKTTAIAAGTVATAKTMLAAPAVHAADPITLRLAGTGVNAYNEIAQKAKEDTGITIEYTTLVSDDVVRRAVTQPTSFDLLDTEYWMLKKIIPTGNILGMDTKRITNYDKIVPIFTKGQMPDGTPVSNQGTAPFEVTYLEKEGGEGFASGTTEFMTAIPTVYNADTLGIRPDLINRPIESWAELLNPEFKGKASILNIPSIGIMDAAMVMEAMGEVEYEDKGNMTRQEIDQTIARLIEAKSEGQFRAFWKDFNESVNLMASGEVVIQSMWSPAVTAVRSQGIPCVYQPLREGYRAWAAGLTVPTHLSGKQLDAAYDFVNWYMDGWVGAFLNRQGYYTAVLETAKSHMSDDEWGFWMDGQPAQGVIKAPDGKEMEKAGSTRDGGSFAERMGRVACWNAVMDEDRYMVRKWNEFIAA
ncbi:MAG: PotD/PotF family extracellular solute-binding protein [Pseudomonadota bacterium]